MSHPRKAHPENSPGDFYVEDGCCLTCGVPEGEAPEVFAWATDGNHCIVARQPQTAESVTNVLRAMLCADLDCIRYRGNDPDMVRRLAEAGLAAYCDVDPPLDAVPVTRSHVTFRLVDGLAPCDTAQLAYSFLHHLCQEFGKHRYGTVDSKTVQATGNRATVEFTWTRKAAEGEHAGAPVSWSFEFMSLPDDRWLASKNPDHQGFWLDDWLGAADCFRDIRWYSAEQWDAGGPYRSTIL